MEQYKESVSEDDVLTSVNSLILYDRQFEDVIPGRHARTINEQVGLIIRELGEFLDAEKHGDNAKQAEELMDFLLSSVTMAAIWHRSKGAGKMSETEFMATMERAVQSVTRKLSDRWLNQKQADNDIQERDN